jgi:hypothetical protein
LFSGTTIEEETEEDLCSSNHFILDRIAEKGSTHNLFRWVRGGHCHWAACTYNLFMWASHILQVGQEWSELTTSSDGSGVGSTHNPFSSVRGGRTHNLFRWVRAGVGCAHYLFRWISGGHRSQSIQVGSRVGITQNLFRSIWGGQYSQPLQVGQGWAALITLSGGSRVSRTKKLFWKVRDRQH